MNKKILLYLLISSIIFANETKDNEYDISTEVKGELKKVYNVGRDLKDGIKDIDIKDIELKNLNIDTKVDIENLTAETKETALNVNDDLNEINIDDIIENVKNLSNTKKDSNIFYMGIGGYKKLDAFNYGINYTSKYENINYIINLKREVAGEYRTHSDKSTDYFSIDMDMDKYNVKISHELLNQDFEGIKNVGTGTDKKYSNTDFDLKYELKNEAKESIFLGTNMYISESTSTEVLRNFSNYFIKLYGEYEAVINSNQFNHILLTEGGYYIDRFDESGTGVLYVDVNDRFKYDKYKDIDFKATAGLEIANRQHEKSETGLNFGFEGTKPLKNNISVSAFINNINKNSNYRNLVNNFKIADDIIEIVDASNNQTELLTEKNFNIGTGINYIKDSLYLEGKLKINNAKNKIVYQEKSISATENAIEIYNYSSNINWIELLSKATYTKDNYKGEFILDLSTLEKIAYSPKSTIKLNGSYEMGKNMYELSLVNYGKFYTTDAKDTSRYLIKSYNLVNFKYNYKLSPEMKISFNINNLFNNKSEEMKGYTINGRKLMLNFEMQY
ncbi:hypothetical protein EV215_0872 [Hypnocyclicus thermotrophus]|uniref:TonB-dependent receptor n=1 Tax=Hypnocyclicus thermotrophus TaxID=1627895 RepID=A0AA46DZA2_9FUSO|nr:TonB-dependent receptor [Hypnocyclicus thermotrophus]TDT71496.1 hypothetical protein EV215_0872 [Hypnocyclicus thermotrophus]